VLTAPIGLGDYRQYVPPVPTEKMLEIEDKLTPEGYRNQLQTNYALKIPPDEVTRYIDARFNIKDSAEYPRWLRAYVNSGQMIYREPVVYEIPLLTQPTLNASLAQTLAAWMVDAHAEIIPNAGHIVFLDAPAKYDGLLLDFSWKVGRK
jgi:hypothetical protein